MTEFLSETCEIIWIIIKNMHLWLILSAIVTIMALREGLIQIAIGFGALFLLILMFKWDVILGEYIMTRSMIAIGLGLIIAFFVWQFKD